MDNKVTIIDKLKQKIEDYIRKNKQKKEEEKRKKEEIRLWQLNNYGKYYSKPKIVFLTIIGLLFGTLEKSSKKEEIKLEKIETKNILLKDKIEIEKEIKKITCLEKEISDIKSENIDDKNKLKKINTIKEKLNNFNDKCSNYQKKYNKEIIKKVPKVIPELAISYEKNIEKVNELNEKRIIINNSLNEEEKKIKEQIETKNNLLNDELKLKDILEKLENLEKSFDSNEKINVLEEKLFNIETEFKVYQERYEFFKNANPNILIIYNKIKQKIDKIKEKIKKLKEKIAEKKGAIKEDVTLDKIEELSKIELNEEEKNNYLLDNLTKEESLIVASILNEINKKEKDTNKKEDNLKNQNNKKQEEQNNISQIKQEEKNDEKQKNKDVKKINKGFRTEEDLAEIRLMETLIYNNLKKQKKEIEKYKKRIEQLDFIHKKRSFFDHILFSIRNISRLVFSLFPLSVFKNKKLGILTSAIFVNNSIRNMRNSVRNIEIPYIEYNKIANLLRKEEKETESAIMICYDSLDQIEEFKKEFLLEVSFEDSKEALEILNSVNKLEKMVEARAKELDKAYNNIQNVKEKGKQKIKKLEDLYNK